MVDAAIYDDVFERRTAMAWGLKGFSPSEYCSTDRIRSVSALVLLIHYRDMDNAQVAELSKNAGLVIYYGGDGGQDSLWNRAMPGRLGVGRIWRKIDRDGTGALTRDEARQLVEFARALESGSSPSEPEFLQRPKECRTLVALAILCQGYLAVQDSTKLDMDDEIQKRLCGVNAGKVNDPWWWMDVFLNDPARKNESDMKAAVKEVQDSVAREWAGAPENRHPIDKLLLSLSGQAQFGDNVLPALEAIRGYLDGLRGANTHGKAVQEPC